MKANRATKRKLLKICLVIIKVMLWCCLFAAIAVAEPRLNVQLDHSQAPINRGDERLVYEATVENEAGDRPKVGDELTCRGTPEDGNSWAGNPAPTFTYKWLRSGEAIPGETAKTYTVAVADEGESIQCIITGTNDPDAVLAGGNVYAPIASIAASLPPVVTEPQPASAPPSGSSRPSMSGPLAATPHATAATEAGSKILTEVATTEGTGTLAIGSNVVTGVTASTGAFGEFQAIAGEGIPVDTTIQAVKETAPGVRELTLSNAATAPGEQELKAGSFPFGPGQGISGPGIPAGTKVLKATGNGITGLRVEMSNAATASAAGIEVVGTAEETCTAPAGWSAGSTISWSFQWLRNGAPIPSATNATYTVQAADTEPPSVLQCEAVAEDEEGGKAVAISGVEVTYLPPPSLYRPPVGGTPVIDFENQTSGPVTLDLEMPGGPETSVYKALGSGWTCTKEAPTLQQVATVTCNRSDPLSPQDSYPPVQVVTSVGKNPPETLIAKAEVSGGGSTPASDEDEYTILGAAVPFGFKAFETEVLDEFGDDYTKAGGHPFSAGASLEFNTHVRVEEEAGETEALNGATRTVRTDTPPGFVGNPQAVVEPCPSIADIIANECPAGSAVGAITAEIPGGGPEDFPVYEMEPEFGVPAQFAFKIGKEYVYTLSPELRPEDGYAITIATPPLAKNPEVLKATVKLCGFGTELGLTGQGDPIVKRCLNPGESGATELPFLTNPTRCSGGAPTTTISADSWEEPGNFVSKSFQSLPLTQCDEVQFKPQITLQPTSRQADSPTGMNVEVTMPTAGLEDPTGTAEANLKSARVTLPVGMAVNPSAANGRGACSLSEIGISPAGVPNDDPVSCPESSKVATVEAETPLLEETLQGNVYIAKQKDNPFNSLLALYLVIDSPKNGILVKLAGKVSPDPITGQLTVSFDDNPEVPVRSVRLHFDGGQRAALINPPLCGNYGSEEGGPRGIEAALSPWNAADPENPSPAETVNSVSAFTIDEGPGGGPCPSEALEPKLRAGLADPSAGAVTPFVLDLSREDGTQRFRAVNVTTPRGLVAYLKGIPYCPEAALVQIPSAAGSGAAQLASPSCPAASQVGTVVAGAGAGTSPFYLHTGRAYLAPPYKGAPLSLAIVNPAVAGPFDLGNVVVRTALRVNPETAEITAVSDPLPTIIEGIPLDVRDIRVNVDRPNFTIAPTNCEPTATSAQVSGEKGAVANVSDRFQVGGCDKLKFKPDLKLRLHGKTRRGAYQRLVATVTYPPGGGYANVASAAVTFPHSTFLAQEHIRTICTRVQFAADQCPQGSIYGKAKATSPLVDYTLQGPVYLRSSSNPLPDVVVALRGPAHQPLEIDLAGRVDSKNGGIRNTFDLVPDAPVTKFTLEMKGGKKSLLVNSRNLCKGTQRATVRLKAQNGLSRDFRPVVKNDCKKGKGKGKGKGRRGG